MKKIFITVLCLLITFSFSACFDRNDNPNNASIRDIPTASADKETSENSEDETSTEESSEDSDNDEVDTSDRTPQTDRKEIENNLRDAQDLINEGCYEDALMIIRGLETRDLTDSEEKRLDDLKKQMLRISN